MKTIEIMQKMLDIPNRKICYLISHKSMVNNLWAYLKVFGIEHNKINHDLLIDVVQTRLEGVGIEREWSETEYINFVIWN